MDVNKLIAYVYYFQLQSGNMFTRNRFNKYLIALSKANIQYNKIDLSTEIYDQDYEITFDRDYKYIISFNITKIIALIEQGKIKYTLLNKSQINLNEINHSVTPYFNKHFTNNSKIIIIDYLTYNCKFTMINGNHSYEYNRVNNLESTFYYIPFVYLTPECFCNEFSHIAYHLIIDLYYLLFLYKSNPIKQISYLIKTNFFHSIH